MLYLHIGMNKAGSTTIQRFLQDDFQPSGEMALVPAFGDAAAWKLSAVAPNGVARDYWVSVAKRLSDGELRALRASFWQEVADQVPRIGARSYVASSEHIFALYGRDRAAIEQLKEHLTRVFGEVKILLYCREQVAMAKSQYAQSVKGHSHHTGSFAGFIKHFDAYEDFWNYYARLSVWGDVFGDDAITARVFDAAAFVKGDLLRDFMAWAGLDPATYEDALAASRPSNVSPGYRQVGVLRYLNMLRHVPAGHRVQSRLANWILARNGRFWNSQMPTKYDEAILRAVSDSNHRFNDRFLKGSPVGLPTVHNDG